MECAGLDGALVAGLRMVPDVWRVALLSQSGSGAPALQKAKAQGLDGKLGKFPGQYWGKPAVAPHHRLMGNPESFPVPSVSLGLLKVFRR